VASDCASGVCGANKLCQAPSCGDSVKNGTETGTDCGGSCPACADGGPCKLGDDCTSKVCVGGVCLAPSCTDIVQNGKETGTDCGGGACPSCASGVTCGVDADCLSGFCKAGTCQTASCSDVKKDGDETGIDCGGSCGPCGDGTSCKLPKDCQSGVCSGNPLSCQTATCTDKVLNGDETGIDCGGSCASKCSVGDGCKSGADCTTGSCNAQTGKCLAATCADNIQNQGESGVDCGGGVCPTCALGKGCGSTADCAGALVCAAGVCSYPTSCKDLHAQRPTLTDAAWKIDPDGPGPVAPFNAFCAMAEQGGGWTLVLVAAAGSSTFRYDSPLWTNDTLLNDLVAAPSNVDQKGTGFISVPFTQILGCRNGSSCLADSYTATSAKALFAGAETVSSTVTRASFNAWDNMAALPGGCNRAGINVHDMNNGPSKCRYGILLNNEAVCEGSVDGGLGFGCLGFYGTQLGFGRGDGVVPTASYNGFLYVR
jgi:hypothetical protein